MKVRVSIIRSEGRESFSGHVIAKSTTHYKVVHQSNSEGEWFAIASDKVSCVEISE